MTMDIADLPAGSALALLRLRRLSKKLVREMVELFNSHVPVARRRPAGGYRADATRAAREAHSLKSSCAQLGAVRGCTPSVSRSSSSPPMGIWTRPRHSSIRLGQSNHHVQDVAGPRD